MSTKDDWLIQQNEIHYHHYQKDYTNNELDIMGSIWEKYHDESGDINWDDHTMYNSAWYEFMTRIMGVE